MTILERAAGLRQYTVGFTDDIHRVVEKHFSGAHSHIKGNDTKFGAP